MARASSQSAQRYPLSSILGTDAGVRLARELARHGGQLSAPDLVRRTGLAKASVARGLEALVGAGAVDTAGTGRSVLYRLRPEHPLAPALSALFEAEERRFQNILEGARSAAEAAGPGLVALWLFGSVARGEDRADSDLDLALVGEPAALPRLADAFRDALVAPAGRMGFSPSVVALGTDDVARLAGQCDPWWMGVTRDAVPLVGQRPDDLAMALARAAGTVAA
ncbi:helix-turn-helix domain-containing protein [Pseudoroseomonas ludipueritiae]|uniref:Helix-turn-helix domain-containing protein n=1 Tax=Pseudoroseomonas ludipueritiae TaxID=198093 RepID=A0ABR7R357_9PROT|nr:helix-turn-helix domain-containing protein [Pseudoroseomonas ludipueritiae]MBC9176179.1 helix-turn-helix domain-containing protein [Pseudoroseomonas ludipueritiae]